jgi:outer membrane biosynthesis protein TonB
MGDGSGRLDKNFIIALLSFIAAVLALVVTITTPELRNFFGLKDSNPPAPVLPAPTPQPEPKAILPKIETPPVKPAAVPKPKPPVIHQAVQEPADPQEYTIGENKSEFAKEAKARLSVSFHDDTGEITAKITISPAGKDSIVLPTVGSGSQEFASSTGVFLVHVLNVDWNSRTVTVQVSRKE